MSMDNIDSKATSPFTMYILSNCASVRDDLSQDNLTAVNICNIFNEFVKGFDKLEKTGTGTMNLFLDAVEEVADYVLLVRPEKLLDPRVIYHPLMYFLHQILIDILNNWKASHLRLNIQETDIFLKIVLIFVGAIEQTPKENSEDWKRVRDVLETKSLMYAIREQIEDTMENKQGLNDDPNICTLGLLTIKLLKGCPFYYNVEHNQCLIDNLIMNCLHSYDYRHSIRLLQHGLPLSIVDRFLLFQCWEYVPFVSNKPPKSNHIFETIYDELLLIFESALDEPPPVAPPSFTYIFERCQQILNIPQLSSFDKHINILLNRLVTMIQSPVEPNTDADLILIIALQTLHQFSRNSEIRIVMKKYQMIPLLNQFIVNEKDEKYKIACDILAEIMDEHDVNNHSNEITSNFIDQLKNLNLNESNPHIGNTLSSVKALMQHKEIQQEFLKQGGLEILIKYICDSDLSKQSDKQLEDCLNILWSYTFNNPEILNRFHNDTKLIERVNHIYNYAKENNATDLQKAAEGFIWKVEKEQKFKEKKLAEEMNKSPDEDEDEELEKYDLMVSYSWADMDLAHRIFKHLTEEYGYRVWLDQEQMHGSTIEAMATAVESAQFILMCMSETYKRSANCQSEAEYAFNRKKHIVPIKMKKDYVADGWLGFILGSRMYIDFGSYEFEKAIVLLHNEIELQKKKRKAAREVAKSERQAQRKIDETKENTEDNEQISKWNEENVRNFFRKNNLVPMLPICDGIRGEELILLYDMCKASSTAMYRSLKFELFHIHQQILPISTFLRFISQMRTLSQPSSIQDKVDTQNISDK